MGWFPASERPKENPENANTEIKLEDAISLNETNKDKSIGDEILEDIDNKKKVSCVPMAQSQFFCVFYSIIYFRFL